MKRLFRWVLRWHRIMELFNALSRRSKSRQTEGFSPPVIPSLGINAEGF
jgi:hypothetical protein